jgi:hypothetical protein
MPLYSDLTLQLGVSLASEDESAEMILQQELVARVASIATEQSGFAEWCRRADELYYSTHFTKWGADLWPDDDSATVPGRSHVSVNTPKVYVDLPAAMMAVEPAEQMLASEDSPEARSAAQALETIREAWSREERWTLKRHKVAVVRELYGRSASYTYYDKAKGRPCVDIIQNPRNLFLGYKSDNYEELEWAAYVTLRDPNSLVADYSIDFTSRVSQTSVVQEDKVVPWITTPNAPVGDLRPRPVNYGPARVEEWDYWYRLPAKKRGKRGEPTKMETWNVVIAGNAIVRGPFKYTEYEGEIPYKPLFNTFIPGTPTGRAALHDMEHLIREKMARISSAAQMIAGATAGDFWQIVGPDAPRVPPQSKPVRNQVYAPGAGNRIETIQPFIAQFQLEQYLTRIDREEGVISGLNDLILGLAPTQALNSSKAINALVSQYELRISLPRLMLYTWDLDTWELVVKVWQKYDANIAKIVDAGGGFLQIIDPSLAPKDDMETANRALSLMGGKAWSQARTMDAVGVDDPEQEQNIIREERTDATLFPQDVQVMAQLMAALQSLGLQAPGGVQSQAQDQIASGQNDLRTALGGGTLQGTNASQGDISQTPPADGSQVPGATPSNNAPFAQGQSAVASPPLLQDMIQGGKVKSRLMTQTKLGRR